MKVINLKVFPREKRIEYIKAIGLGKQLDRIYSKDMKSAYCATVWKHADDGEARLILF